MIFGRILGWLCLGAALLAASAEIATRLRGDAWHWLALDEFWTSLAPASLKAFHDLVAAGPAPAWVWDSGIAAALGLPAWPALLVLGAALLYFCRVRMAPAAPMPR